jgi:hypothetical protein
MGKWLLNDFQPTRETLCRSRRRRQLQGWLFALLGSLLLSVPTIRTSELNEISSANERVENVAFASRPESLRRTTQHGRREAIVFTSSIQARLGREQRTESLSPSDGHRLPNGLLAPMTC